MYYCHWDIATQNIEIINIKTWVPADNSEKYKLVFTNLHNMEKPLNSWEGGGDFLKRIEKNFFSNK